jgi:hypothetical protein|tara:strand:+ start:187 stop:537 length:351 start_codon:yes stop_codon:yes gene_type:complete
MKGLLVLLLIAGPVSAQSVTPNFTQGSMQATTTTTIDIERTIEHEIYGGDYKSWSGTNVTPSGDLENSSTTFSVTTAGEPFQLEITERAAGVVETFDITETIDQSSTTTSLSVFSQ